MTTKISGDTGIEFPDATQQMTRGVPNDGPCFSAYVTGTKSIPSITYTKLIFDGVDFSTPGVYEDSRFTPNVSGLYLINANVYLQEVGAGMTGAMKLNVSDDPIRQKILAYSGNGYTILSGSVLVAMNGTTDFVELLGYSSKTGTTNYGVVPENTHFSGFLVRAL